MRWNREPTASQRPFKVVGVGDLIRLSQLLRMVSDGWVSHGRFSLERHFPVGRPGGPTCHQIGNNGVTHDPLQVTNVGRAVNGNRTDRLVTRVSRGAPSLTFASRPFLA